MFKVGAVLMCSPDTPQIKQDGQEDPLKRLRERFLSPSELITRMATFHANAACLVIHGSPEHEIHSRRAMEYANALEDVLHD